ncbi:MAG: creatininase family protein [Synergistaceae bacterium]|jgi:creatinine amidohydrolase|nr:creatininase family protein [Synergistaceae bacterium]
MEMNTLDFQELIKKTGTVIIPIGACEVWGPHLPMGADTIVAEEIAARLADRRGWLVGPTLTVGDSIMVWGPGTITVRPESLKAYLDDICGSLVKHGAKRFVFMSPHVGNTSIISQVAWRMRMDNGVSSCIFDWWRFIQPISAKEGILDNEGWMAHGHASEAGTSCFLYLRPDLVKMDRAVKAANKVDGFYDYPDIIRFHLFDECGDTWILGDPTCATKEKGERIVTAALKRMEEFLDKWNLS